MKTAATAQAKLDAVLDLIAVTPLKGRPKMADAMVGPDDAPSLETKLANQRAKQQKDATKPTAADKRKASSTKRVQDDVARQLAAAAKNTPAEPTQVESNAKALTTFINSKDEDGAPATTGYQGPMKALRDRVKAGKYTKAANGQPSCGDEVATILGALEPAEVIKACLIAMDITNPYPALNIGQQSMNLRNKLRGQLKRGEIGMGVLREAVEVVVEGKTAPKVETPAPAPEAPAAAPKTSKPKAKRTPKPAK